MGKQVIDTSDNRNIQDWLRNRSIHIRKVPAPSMARRTESPNPEHQSRHQERTKMARGYSDISNRFKAFMSERLGANTAGRIRFTPADFARSKRIQICEARNYISILVGAGISTVVDANTVFDYDIVYQVITPFTCSFPCSPLQSDAIIREAKQRGDKFAEATAELGKIYALNPQQGLTYADIEEFTGLGIEDRKRIVNTLLLNGVLKSQHLRKEGQHHGIQTFSLVLKKCDQATQVNIQNLPEPEPTVEPARRIPNMIKVQAMTDCEEENLPASSGHNQLRLDNVIEQLPFRWRRIINVFLGLDWEKDQYSIKDIVSDYGNKY